jgi:hypothetical protein
VRLHEILRQLLFTEYIDHSAIRKVRSEFGGRLGRASRWNVGQLMLTFFIQILDGVDRITCDLNCHA